MYLLINTAFSEVEITLFNEHIIDFYKKWKTRNESFEIIQEISKLDLSKLKGVLVCNGPGRFISLRVGVALSQTLSYTKKIPIYSFTSFQYMKVLCHKNKENIVFLQQVGMNEVFVNGELKKFEELTQKPTYWAGELKTPQFLPEIWEEKELPERNLDFFLELLKNLKPVKHVSIEYGKKPSISISKK